MGLEPKLPAVPAGKHRLPASLPVALKLLQQSSSLVTATPTVVREAQATGLAPLAVNRLPATQETAPPDIGVGVPHVNGGNPPASILAPPVPVRLHKNKRKRENGVNIGLTNFHGINVQETYQQSRRWCLWHQLSCCTFQ